MAQNNSPQNYMNKGLSYQNLTRPTDINLNFIVDSANGNGLGVRSIKSNGYVNSVFMHTSATPGVLNGQINPNPAVGFAVVTLKGNFSRYIGGFGGAIAPLTSTSQTSTTAGNPYTITSLGTTTLVQWQAAGLPKGMTPAVGSSFIALATGAIGGTGTVGSPAPSAVQSIQVVPDPNLTLNNANTSQNGGAQIIMQFTNSSGLVTPADGTVIGMTLRLDGSSVNVDGL